MNKDFWKGCLMCLGVWFIYPMIFYWLVKSNSIFSQVVLMVIGLILLSYFLQWLKGKVK